MNISHVVTSIDSSTGGPARSVTNLIESMLREPRISIDLYCGASLHPVKDNFDSSTGKIHFSTFGRFNGLIGLKNNIETQMPDLLHGHGLWQRPVHQMASTARKMNIPYIISPRGMLDVWSIAHKAYKKKIALTLYQRNDLEKATALHATSMVEAENIREAGFQNPIAVIPNGIFIPPVVQKIKSGEKKTALFLSRLIQNKGVEELLLAWSSLNESIHKEWKLVIVGAGEKDYEKKLKKIMTDLRLINVSFKGPAYGLNKERYFLEADLFVLPTYTENFGIAIAEALAYKVPVITTKGAPWASLLDSKSGWWIEKGIESLTNCLTDVLQLKHEDLQEMGENGRKLVENNYSIDIVSDKMINFYKWIITDCERPDFIITEK